MEYNLTDCRFGMLLVLFSKKYCGIKCWVCLCSCSKFAIVPTFQLISGNKSSCGCLVEKKSNLIGKIFGDLTVVKKHTTCGTRPRWTCVCACGGQIVVPSRYLQRGSTRNCGCKRTEAQDRGDKIREKTELHRAVTMYMGMASYNAKRKGRESTITRVQCLDLITSKCHYCNADPINGIDRVDNSLGYVEGNMVPCCTTCNYMKKDMAYADFISIVHRISKNMKRKK